jgi:hypothetical protein
MLARPEYLGDLGKNVLAKILRRLTFKQILDALKRQVLVGRTYLDIAKGLSGTGPVILGVAPTFFDLTFHGSLELAQMAIARLYDQGKVRNSSDEEGY